MSTRYRSLAFSALLASLFLGLDRTDAASLQPLAQGNLIAIDPLANQTHGVLKWSHGAFLFAEGDSKTFYVFNREGNLVSTVVRPELPEASSISTGSFSRFDRAADGSVALDGVAWSSSGLPSPFLAWISPDGQSSRVIRTAPYWPAAVCLAPDGTIWTAGLEMINLDLKAPGVNQDGGVLRHFDTTGNLIASAAPQSGFNGRQLGSGYVVATRDRVGWYGSIHSPGRDTPREQALYLELSTDTMQIHSYPGLPAGLWGEVLSFTLTDAGNALLSFLDWHSKLHTTYTLDRAAQKWVPIQVPAVAGQAAPWLLGSDGERLAFKGKQSASFFNVAP